MAEVRKGKNFVEAVKFSELKQDDVIVLKVPVDSESFLPFSELEEIAPLVPCKILVIDDAIKVGLVKKEQLQDNVIYLSIDGSKNVWLINSKSLIDPKSHT